jgi:serine-type D-Ala-D-Ala carboxypeptidase (penicillin-binding protein 5/6)
MSPIVLLTIWLSLMPVGSNLISIPQISSDPVTYRLSFYRNEETNFEKYGITKDENLVAPVIEASGAIAVDVATGAVLWHKDAYKRLPIASITKLMTILLVMEEVQDKSEYVTFSSLAAEKEGSRIGVEAGEEFTVNDLIKASLVRSANDAVYALAEHVSGTSQDFVNKMNEKAAYMHLGSTLFANPVGYDNEENFSSAYEVTLIARELLKYPEIRDITALKTLTIANKSGKKYKLDNTNKLLDSYLNVYGLKTGTTDAAGQSFVALGKVDGDREIMVVVLNSNDRFQEAKIMFDWVERAFTFPKQ